MRPDHASTNAVADDWKDKVQHPWQIGADTSILVQTKAEGQIAARQFRDIHNSPGGRIVLTRAPGQACCLASTGWAIH